MWQAELGLCELEVRGEVDGMGEDSEHGAEGVMKLERLEVCRGAGVLGCQGLGSSVPLGKPRGGRLWGPKRHCPEFMVEQGQM